MEVSCCFQKLVGGVCASDKRHEGAVVVPLSSCQKIFYVTRAGLELVISTLKLSLF